MIVVDPEQTSSKQQHLVPKRAVGTGSDPPSFDDHPPPFTPYAASYFTSGQGDVVSHDPHLNEDSEALYRFLLSQASAPPRLVLHCRGSHSEVHTRLVPEHRAGRIETTTETYTERITDFDFKIDVSQHIMDTPTHWSFGDSVPAYRGRMFHEVDVGEEKRKAKRAEITAAKAWDKERRGKGYPPWIGNHYAWREDQPHIMHGSSVLKSSWTLRQWADDYCTSKKYLKEFVYDKVVYGWNFDAIKAATCSVVGSTQYTGDVEIDFQTSNARIFVRSENNLSRALSNRWVKFVLIVTLVYPFLWLFKRFHSRGGGKWGICGGAYALKRIERVDPQITLAETKYPDSPFGIAGNTFRERPSGLSEPDFPGLQSRVVGLREGTWFRQWEGTIRMAREERPAAPVLLLDGY
ncbi:hypothetical protein F5I97DRAFT_1944265 [Phlebopus sp. FC_14]|nr:hypothetical protein F5I97DRAFT_1944265 [Phlebopus sp. FC_14]